MDEKLFATLAEAFADVAQDRPPTAAPAGVHDEERAARAVPNSSSGAVRMSRVQMAGFIIQSMWLEWPIHEPAKGTGRPRKFPKLTAENAAILDRRRNVHNKLVRWPKARRIDAVHGEILRMLADRLHSGKAIQSERGLARDIEKEMYRPRLHGQRRPTQASMGTIRRTVATAVHFLATYHPKRFPELSKLRSDPH